MKRILPILFSVIFLVSFALTNTSVSSFVAKAVAADTTSIQNGTWVQDPEVTYVGKTAARAGAFLDWTLENYNWVALGSADQNPLRPFWIIIRNIVYSIVALFVLATAFIMIITRGRNITITKFLPRFVGILLLITFSFALTQFLYQITDIIQGFFLKNPDSKTFAQHAIINQQNLLNIAFKYADFIGIRRVGFGYDESASMTLLLTKLTAVTYYAMSAILIIRKIILWFFIIISPIFPLLLFYSPIRNTAKIWIGEFFRWLLYAPLFALLLAGLVSVWQSQIPLFSYKSDGVVNTTTSDTKNLTVGKDEIYPTSVNILLGGPRQQLSIKNSVNLPETYALYIVSLIMLWAVIILPFILLRIFLDYLSNLSLHESVGMQQIIALTNSLVNKPPPVAPQPLPSFPTGKALTLPFGKHLTLPVMAKDTLSQSAGLARSINTSIVQQNQRPVSVNRNISTNSVATEEIMRFANLSVPTMRDIARIESTSLQSQASQDKSVVKTERVLTQIANPQVATTSYEREQYRQLKERLQGESKKGNIYATTILTAANTTTNAPVSAASDSTTMVNVLNQIANPEKISQSNERLEYQKVKETIEREKQNGNPLATMVSNFINSTTNVTNQNQTVQDLSQSSVSSFLQSIAHPESITNTSDQQTITQIREEIRSEAAQNNPIAVSLQAVIDNPESVTSSLIQSITTQLTSAKSTDNSLITRMLNQISKVTSTTSTENVVITAATVSPLVSKLQSIEKIENTSEKSSMTELKEQITTQAQANNPLAIILQNTINSSQPITPSLLTTLMERLTEAKNNGDPLAQAILSRLQVKEVITTTQNIHKNVTVETVSSFIEKIKNIETSTNTTEKTEYTNLRQEIEEEARKENIVAKQLLDIFTNTAVTDKPSLINLTQLITTESQKGNSLATKILETATKSESSVTLGKIKQEVFAAKAKGDSFATMLYSLFLKRNKSVTGHTTPTAPTSLPVINRIQTVSLDDYEAVKKIWKENYKNLEEPMRNGRPVGKREYIQEDIAQINQTVNLLSSPIEEQRKEGLQMVSSILPFLLIGGFSQTEIIGYLKAKQEAAKEASETMEEKEAEEDTKLFRVKKVEEKPKEMYTMAEESLPGEKKEELPFKEQPLVDESNGDKTSA